MHTNVQFCLYLLWLQFTHNIGLQTQITKPVTFNLTIIWDAASLWNHAAAQNANMS